MEEYFPFADQLEVEVGVEPLASNYEDMISDIILQTPDPRFLPDNYES